MKKTIELPKEEEIFFNDVSITFSYCHETDTHLANLWFKQYYVEVAMLRNQEDLNDLLGYGEKFQLCSKESDVLKIWNQWSCGGGEVEDFNPKPTSSAVMQAIKDYVKGEISNPEENEEAEKNLESILKKLL